VKRGEPVNLITEKVAMDAEQQPKWLRSTKGAPFTGIGSLEADILAVVWDLHETSERAVTVRSVYERLLKRRQIAYTTVMTVMNNLVKKHLLDQDKRDVAYAYTPAIPGREVARTVLTSVVDRLLAEQYNVAVSQLLDLDRELTPEELEELRAWVRQRFGA
jgi:predicted transcriptional regulator